MTNQEKLEWARQELEFIQGEGRIKNTMIYGSAPLAERVFPRTTEHWDEMDVIQKWEYCNEYSKRYLNGYYIFTLELGIYKAIPDEKKYNSKGEAAFIHYHNNEPTVDLYDELYKSKQGE